MPEGTPEGEAKVQITDKNANPIGQPIDINIVAASTPTPSVDDSGTTEQVPANEVPTEIDQTVTSPKPGLTGIVTDSNNKPISNAKVEVDPETGKITVTIPKGADPGEATIIITNDDGTIKYGCLLYTSDAADE